LGAGKRVVISGEIFRDVFSAIEWILAALILVHQVVIYRYAVCAVKGKVVPGTYKAPCHKGV
jgi:hypothetical protein